MRLSPDPRVWFRGTGNYVGSSLTATGLQNGIYSCSSAWLNCNPYICAALGGGISSLFVCPTDLIFAQQKQLNLSAFKTAKYLVKTHGAKVLWRALPLVTGREIIYTTGYKKVSPEVEERLARQGGAFTNEFVTKLVSSIVAGLSAGLVSQPLDSGRGRLQGNLLLQETTLQAIVRKDTLVGGLPRAGVITVEMLVMAYIFKWLSGNKPKQTSSYS